MNRRDFIATSLSAGLLAGGAPGSSGVASAQQQNVPVVGFLEGPWSGRVAAEVRRGLTADGLVSARKEEFSRWSKFQVDQIAKNTEDLVGRRQAALILAFSNKAALVAATVTSTTPIIFLADNLVAADLVDRLNLLHGNLTGSLLLWRV